MPPEIRPPLFEDLVEDLQILRREGITKLRSLVLPALEQATLAIGETDPDERIAPAAMETAVRRGIQGLDESRLADSAAILYGLDTGSRGNPPPELRKWAAEDWGVSLSRFRHRYESEVLGQLAETLLRLAHERALRQAQLDLSRKTPVSSRLAINWLERFEAYYKIWSPVSGLAGDLTAFHQTLLEEDRPFDREPDTLHEGDPGQAQEEEALNYASDALVHYAEYLTTVEEFMRRFGGLWLLGDRQAEEEVADAVAQIRLNAAASEEDDAYLRRTFDREADRDHLAFRQLMREDETLGLVHRQWINWALQCECAWDIGEVAAASEEWPTSRNNAGIDPKCLVHSIARACADYCSLIDDDWGRVADWYRIAVI